jgi:hypothetical protein
MLRQNAVQIRSLAAADIPACERILRSLPDWFGLEESNRAYVSKTSCKNGATQAANPETR